ncbi:MAG: hypothetical protein H7147_04170 [Frankiaceae bacterium]|nr:hypothetical protein [Arenimonas sp.]
MPQATADAFGVHAPGPEYATDHETRLVTWIKRGFERVLRATLRRFAPVVGFSFLPEFKEGHFIIAMTTLPVTSLDESMRLEGRRSVDLMRSRVDQSRDSDQPYAISRENVSRVSAHTSHRTPRSSSMKPRLPRLAPARAAFCALTLLLLAACNRPPERTDGTAAATPSGGAVTSPPPPASDADPMAGMAHDDSQGAGLDASADVSGRFGSGQPVTVVLHVRAADGTPLASDALQLVHTKRLHVLAVDPSLTDYSHSHPVATATPGDWTFQFTPEHDRPYHLWLDLTPIGGKQAYVLVPVNASAPGAPVARTLATTASVGGIDATLAFDAPPMAGQAAMGHVQVRRGGKPFASLEPVMGAYAHVVAIAEDFKTIAHVHPLGAEPTAAGQRGGPAIDFHIEPAKPGFLKLFAQVRVDGRDLFLPFGVDVAEPGTAAVPAASHH